MGHKEDDGRKKVRILSRARNKKWERSYNVKDVDMVEMYWLNLDEWEVKRKEETAEPLWGEREDDNREQRSKMRAKEDELRSWKEGRT